MKNKPHWRIVNSGDIVPHLPPEPFFSHPGQRIILFENRKRRNAKSWLAERLAAVHEFVDKTMDKLNIADIHRLSAHESNSYIPRLLDDYKRVSR